MICCRCKQDLPPEAFYKSDKYRCKECHRKYKREAYDKKHPQIYMSGDGKVKKRSLRGHPYIFWNGNMLSDLKKHYPNTSNRDMVDLLGVSERTIVRKARELGLEKSEEYVSEVNKGKSFLAHIEKRKRRLNKG